MNDAIPRPQAKTRKALTPLLEIRNLTKSYDGQHAVDDVSLTIYKGEIFALLGASGCGKSTLLRMLAGFEQPSAGQIMLDGVDLSQVPPYLRPINMMFQSYALFPHMTVEQNIARTHGRKYALLHPGAAGNSGTDRLRLCFWHPQAWRRHQRTPSPLLLESRTRH